MEVRNSQLRKCESAKLHIDKNYLIQLVTWTFRTLMTFHSLFLWKCEMCYYDRPNIAPGASENAMCQIPNRVASVRRSQEKFRVNQRASGLVRYQPLITRYANDRLRELCHQHHVNGSVMLEKIVSYMSHQPPPKLDHHYSQGFIKPSFWITPATRKAIDEHAFTQICSSLCAWILAYPKH